MATPEQKQANIQNLLKELGKDEPAYRKIAEGLTNQGVASLKDIQYTRTPQYANQQLTFQPRDQDFGSEVVYAGYYLDGKKVLDVNDPKIADLKAKGEWREQSIYDPDGGSATIVTAKLPAGYTESWTNKTTGKPITASRFGMLGNGEGGISGGDLFFSLKADDSGNITVVPDWSPRARSAFRDIAPVIGIGLLLIPGIGQAIGASILGGSAATIAAAVGLSEVAVATAVGAATISSGMTALQGGTVKDVIKAGLSAGAASGVNFAAGGGVAGAAAGSAVGTAIQGGDLSQVASNAFVAAVGAGVQGALPDNPDAGKIIGSAARTYIATGGNVDKTLLSTAATAVGTLDSPASDAAAQETAAKNIEAVTQSDAASKQQAADYQEKLNQYNIDKAIYEQTYGPIETAAAPVVTPAAGATLDPQTIVATTPDVAPVVTDLDLVKQVAEQPTPTVEPAELERVIVQGQGANVANVAPVQTEITSPTANTTRTLDPVTVTATTEKAPEPGFEEYKPLPEKKVSDVVTDVATLPEKPAAPEAKTEEPKKESKKLYPTVTGVRPPARPGRQPIITGASPARLLADALAAYRPSGAIEGEESGKERQNVWNEKSLRLKDALGL